MTKTKAKQRAATRNKHHFPLGSYIRMLKHVSGHKLLMSLSVIFSLLYAASNVYVMPLIQDIIREASQKNLGLFLNHIGNAFLLFTIRLIGKYGQFYTMTRVSNRVIIQLRMQLYEKLQRHCMSFYSKWKSGDLISRVFSDVEEVKLAIFLSFESFFPNILVVLGVSSYLFYLNWQLASLTLIGLPFFISIIIYFSNRLKRLTGQIQRKKADITHLLQENITNIQTVQSYTMEESEIRKFKKQHERNFLANMREARIKVTQEPLIAFLQFAVFLGIACYGGYLNVTDQISGPELLSFFGGVVLLVDPVTILGSVYPATYQKFASSERVFEVLDTESKVKSPKKPHPIKDVKGSISFKHVTFSYSRSSDAALNDINVDIKPGEHVALVGLSGSGKSTFINLIPRFYDPSEGTITLDNIDIRNIELTTLRDSIGIVPQEPILFRGTLLENIRYGKPEASLDEVIEATKKAHAWDFIKDLNGQLLYNAGDRGKHLSGGQRQRVAVARAILKNPKILILDEATSALDSESEKYVQLGLKELMKNKTTFVIAHRLSTVMDVNRILVVEKGKIVEEGNHQDLLTLNGIYKRLFTLQFKNT